MERSAVRGQLIWSQHLDKLYFWATFVYFSVDFSVHQILICKSLSASGPDPALE